LNALTIFLVSAGAWVVGQIIIRSLVASPDASPPTTETSKTLLGFGALIGSLAIDGGLIGIAFAIALWLWRWAF
jgi:hypothetical protein